LRTEGNATELYPANFDLQALNPAVFSPAGCPTASIIAW